MKSAFSGYYLPSSGELDEIWARGVVVLDTNVLLDLYRVPEVTRNKILDMLGSWKGRLWVPHQVGLEFHSRRVPTIAEVCRRAESVPAELRAKFEAFRKHVEEMELQNRGCPEVTQLMDELVSIEGKIFEKASQALAGGLEPGGDDPILAAIDDLLGDAVGLPPESQDALKKIYLEGEERYALKMGPGYEDAKKAQSDSPRYMAGGLVYEKQYGDLVLWKQLIAHAKDQNILSVLFVTKDVKKDWWQIVPGKGRVAPLPELCQEISKDAGVEKFWMFTLEEALVRYGHQRGVEVQQAIQDVRNAESMQASSSEGFDSYAKILHESPVGWERQEDDVYLLSAVQALDIVIAVQEPHLVAGRSVAAPEYGAVAVTWDALIQRQPELQSSARSAAASLSASGAQKLTFIILAPANASSAHIRDAKVIADHFWSTRVQVPLDRLIVGCVLNGRFRRLDLDV